MSRRRIVSALVLLVLGLVVGALLEATLVRGQLLIGRDLLPYVYPRLAVISDALAEGRIARWNPWSTHGASLFGPQGMGVVYPGYLLFRWLDLGSGMAWFVALHLLWAAAGTWRLTRAGLGERAAAASGLAYALGGFVSSMYWATPYLVSAAWLPWAVLGARALARRPAFGIALGGAAIAACLTACEPQGALTTAGALVAAALWGARGQGEPMRRAGVYALLAVAIAGAAGSWQVLSIVSDSGLMDRALPGWTDSRWGLAPGPLALDLLAPGALGERAWTRRGLWGLAWWGGEVPWCGLTVGVSGLGTVVVALTAPLSPRRARARRFAGGLVAVGVALAALDAGRPIGLRFPAKWLVLTALGLAWLVGIGVAALGPAAAEAERSRRLLSRFLGGFAIVWVPLAVVLVAAPGPVEAWLAERLEPDLLVPREARVATAIAVWRSMLVAALGWLVCRARRPGWRRRTWTGLWVGLLALDLLTAAKPGVVTTREPMLAEPPLARALTRAPGSPPGAPPRLESKVATSTYRGEPEDGLTHFEHRSLLRRDLLTPNVGYAHGVRAIPAFESTGPAVLRYLRQRLEQEPLPPATAFALFDVEYTLLTRAGFMLIGPRSGGLRVVSEVRPDLLLIKNEACPPWAYVPARVVQAETLEDAASRLLAREAPARVEAVLGPDTQDGETAALAASPPGAPGRVRVAAFSDERIELEVRVDRPAWLVVREALSPDWSVAVDDQPTLAVRADLLFRAVRIPAGEHRVVFAYAPWWWDAGRPATGFGAIALLLAFILGLRERERS